MTAQWLAAAILSMGQGSSGKLRAFGYFFGIKQPGASPI